MKIFAGDNYFWSYDSLQDYFMWNLFFIIIFKAGNL